MIELLVSSLVLRGPGDPVPTPPDHEEITVWDGVGGRGQRACVNILRGEPSGTSCTAVPTRAPLVPQERPQQYTEWTRDYARGQRLCADDLRQDANPQSTCDVRPFDDYPGEVR